MTDASANLAQWNALKEVDRTFTKKITGKTYGGDSPNPTYVIRKLTEQLGPIGQLWGFNVIRSEIRYGKPHQVEKSREAYMDSEGKVTSKRVEYEIIREEHHEVEIEFWRLDNKGNRHSFSAFGGTPMLYVSRKGMWIHDEDAAKKSLTDAYVKAASWLGACADIFLGIFDDKYQSAENSNDQPEGPSQKAASGERKSTAGDASGW